MKKILGISLAFACLAMPAQAENIRISFGESLPPWVMNDGEKGIFVDLMKACLEPSGHTISVRLFPYARRLVEYQNNQVDAVTDINENIIEEASLRGYFTGYLYAYENFVYSRQANGLHLNSILDIGQRSMVSWQGAKVTIGGDYQKMADNNPNYREIDRQEAQVRLLATDRTDFIQMDREIFNYYRAKLISEKKIAPTFMVDEFALLGASLNGVLFRSEQVRDDCVRNLENLPAEDPLQAVLKIEQ